MNRYPTALLAVTVGLFGGSRTRLGQITFRLLTDDLRLSRLLCGKLRSREKITREERRVYPAYLPCLQCGDGGINPPLDFFTASPPFRAGHIDSRLIWTDLFANRFYSVSKDSYEIH